MLLAAALVVLGAGADVLPTAQHLAWADCEVGVIIHHDLQVYQPAYDHNRDWTNAPSAAVFNPSSLDTDQWIETAAAAGAKYAVLVAKHCSGFALWPTRAHDYSVAASPWRGGKGDVVADFVASCRKYGVRPGIYASVGFAAKFGIGKGAVDDAKWNAWVASIKTQLTELWTNYGELFEIWFDGGNLPLDKGGREIEDILLRLQPNAVVFQGNPARFSSVRWIGNERAHAPEICWCRTNAGTSSDGMKEAAGAKYSGTFDGRFWSPGEADMPNRDQNHAFQGGWFWRAGEDDLAYAPEELLDRYFLSVGRGCNMLLGMVIDDRGLVPEADVEKFKAFGNLVKRLYANKVAAASGRSRSFTVEVPADARPNLLSVAEDIREGENVRSFTLHGFDGRHWHTLATGQGIGHKRIVRFRPGKYEKYKLDCWDARDWRVPVIRDFSLYEVGSAK